MRSGENRCGVQARNHINADRQNRLGNRLPKRDIYKMIQNNPMSL